MPRPIQPSPDIIQILAGSTYFNGFDHEILAKLALGTTSRTLKTGEILFLEDDACTGLFILQSGSIKLFKLAPSGREFILRILEAGTSFNEVPVFDGGRNPVNASALEPSQVWIVKKETILSAMSERPELYQSIVLRLGQNLRIFVNRLEDLAFYQVSQRLARLLLEESQDAGLMIAMRQDELASRLGTVREVVSRALRELERNGAIKVARRQIHILDMDRLRECC